jgi:uncharacterized iron-regulated protein
MQKHLIVLIFLCFTLNSSAQKKKEAYNIFTAEGKKVKYDKMLKRVAEADVFFMGEYHDNPISHWLQLEITQETGDKRELILGAEMFEADNQEALDKYLSGDIDVKGLDSLARLWGNFKTDYQPLVDYAKDNQLVFVATNIPRRFANRVYKNGFETLEELSDMEKSWVAPLPFPYDPELPTYKDMIEMMGDHGSPTMPMAQASKDATMAWFIHQNFEDGKLFIHYNGAYHSDYKEGIIWYLNQYSPGLDIVTISTVSQTDVGSLSEEHNNRADYIIVVDEDMTRTNR